MKVFAKRERWLRRIPLVALVLASISAVSAQSSSDRLEVDFGGAKILFDKTLIVGRQPKTPSITMPKDGILTLKLPPSVAEGYSPPCKPGFLISLYREVGTKIPLKQNPLLRHLRPVPTQYTGIDKLEYDGNRILDLYQFHSPSLVDSLGDQISFLRQTILRETIRIRMDWQVTPELRLTMIGPFEDCFFENGEAMVGRLHRFILNIIK